MITINNLRRPNFEPEEFIQSKTAEKLGIINKPNSDQLVCGMILADKMQEISDAVSKMLGYRVKIISTSGFRCYALNKVVGGAPNSWHMQFLADDFNIEGFEPYESVELIRNSGVSVDKCFVERGCVHVQTATNPAKNRNFFGTAQKINGEWLVTPEIKKV